MTALNFFKKSAKKKQAESPVKAEAVSKKEPQGEKDKKEKAVEEIAVASNPNTEPAADVLLRPRVTEKATSVQENNVYVFEVFPKATKTQISKAIQNIYKIEPKKINILKSPDKKVFIRGKEGKKSGVKKAYIYLKEGDRIDIV